MNTNPDLAREMLDAAGWIDGDDEDTIREKMIDGKKNVTWCCVSLCMKSRKTVSG
jgi:hypothetical protein